MMSSVYEVRKTSQEFSVWLSGTKSWVQSQHHVSRCDALPAAEVGGPGVAWRTWTMLCDQHLGLVSENFHLLGTTKFSAASSGDEQTCSMAVTRSSSAF